MLYAKLIGFRQIFSMLTTVYIFLIPLLPLALRAQEISKLNPSAVVYLEIPHRYAVVAIGYPGYCNNAVEFLKSHGIDANAQGSVTYEVDVSYANRWKAIKILRSSKFHHIRGFEILRRPHIRVNRRFGKVLAP